MLCMTCKKKINVQKAAALQTQTQVSFNKNVLVVSTEQGHVQIFYKTA